MYNLLRRFRLPLILLFSLGSGSLFIWALNSLTFFVVNQNLHQKLSMTTYELIASLPLWILGLVATKSLWRASAIYSILYGGFITITSIKSYYLIEYLKLEDFFYLNDLLFVMSFWQITICLFILLAAVVATFKLINPIKTKPRQLLYFLIGLISLNAFLRFYLNDHNLNANQIPTWSTKASTEKIGPLASFWSHALMYEIGHWAPEPRKVQSALQLIRNEMPLRNLDSERATNLPNIYIILVESLWDPRLVTQHFKVQDAFSTGFRKLHQENGENFALTPNISGGTPNSEFELLCGLPTAESFFIFRKFLNADLDCLPRVLKNLGYTTYALHPGYRTMWNRNYVYPKIGFEHYLAFNDIRELSQSISLPLTSEKGFLSFGLKFIEEKVEEKKPNLFYLLTVGLHTPFRAPSNSDQSDFSEVKSADMKNYLLMLSDSTSALGQFFIRIRKADPEGIILMLGDHSPHSIESLLKDLNVLSQLPDSELFKTPLLTANLDMPDEQWIRLPHLPSLIYRKLGLPAFSSVSDLYQKPNLGHFNYNKVYHLAPEKVKNCVDQVSDCETFFQMKEAYSTILEDHFLGDQTLKF